MDKIFVTRSSMPSFEEYTEEIRSIWESRWLTNAGEKHQRLTAELKDFLGVKEIELFCNGHQALEVALSSLGIPKGSEVITTPFTFTSTTHAIVRSGLRPVFCDIREEDFTMDPEKIEALITEKTAAIVPVHVYGNVCRVDEIADIAARHGLKVVYDAAHAFGEMYRGRGVGSFGDASMFSFHATKVFHTIEGGAVCCSDENMVREMGQRRNFGLTGGDEVGYVGTNAKMNEFAAAMGLCNLRHVREAIDSRRQAAETYRAELGDVRGIRLNTIQPEVTSNYAYFPILVDEKTFGMGRDELMQRLNEQGIYSRRYFYPATNALACYRGKTDPEATPIAKKASECVLALPLYEELTKTDVHRVCSAIRAAGGAQE